MVIGFHFARFSSLPVEQRVDYIRRWEDGVATQRGIVDLLKNDVIDIIVNTTEGRQAIADSFTLRRTALQHKVAYSTTLAGARASLSAIREADVLSINRLQDLHEEVAA